MTQANTSGERRYKIALPLPLRQTYDYLCNSPEPLPQGVRVRVPFGQRQLVGYVVSEANDPAPEFELKYVKNVLDSKRLWPEDVWQLVNWAADYYHHSLGDAAANSLPGVVAKGRCTRIFNRNLLRVNRLGAGTVH